MAHCPNCGYNNRPGELICENCGRDMYIQLLNSVSTRKLDATGDTGDLDLSAQPIVFYIGNDTLAIDRDDNLIVGRVDIDNPDTQIDVDLELYQAQEKGLSRQHMRLDATHNPPMVTDLGSYNGTFVNGQKLVPDQPHPLSSGDELRLARLILRVYFK